MNDIKIPKKTKPASTALKATVPRREHRKPTNPISIHGNSEFIDIEAGPFRPSMFCTVYVSRLKGFTVSIGRLGEFMGWGPNRHKYQFYTAYFIMRRTFREISVHHEIMNNYTLTNNWTLWWCIIPLMNKKFGAIFQHNWFPAPLYLY